MTRIKQYKKTKYYVSENGDVFKRINPYESNKGYKNVKLYYDNQTYSVGVHRLVAELYIPNPEQLPQENHIDEDKHNNNVGNLEWCSASYNSNYGSRIKKMALKHQKPVIAIDMNGFQQRFDSIKNAGKFLSIDSSSISAALKGRRKTAGGYWWVYDS